MTDWLMVIITFIYVVATIFICVFNWKSAKAAREQLAESQRQFNESNRPYISCRYILVNRAFCGIRFHNYGNKPAKNVKFKINQEFLDGLPDGSNHFKERFSKLNTAEYFFGIDQYYDFFFSEIEDFTQNRNNFEVEINYSCDDKEYSEKFTIKFESELPIYSADNPNLVAIKSISKNIKHLDETVRDIKNMLENTKRGEN